VRAEFQDLDLEATMGTMTDDPYVHHVPTIAGGNGTARVRDFYGHHFIGQWPDGTETRQVSRTIGENQVVDELVITFTHDRQLARRSRSTASVCADRRRVTTCDFPRAYGGTPVIVAGIVLLILGALLDIGILWTIGVVLIVVGAVLWILGAVGRPVAGRRYYY
jgi:hypothetical protein